MPKRRGRGRRGAAYRRSGQVKRELTVAQAPVSQEAPSPAVKRPATTPAAPRIRSQQPLSGTGLPAEEHFRIVRNDLKRVGIVTAVCIILLLILWWVL